MKPQEIYARKNYLGNQTTQEIEEKDLFQNISLAKQQENQVCLMHIPRCLLNTVQVGGLGLPSKPMKWVLKNLWGRV